MQKLGAHGLFSDTDDPINLSRVQQEVADHPRNVWTNVGSLRREDAARIGYDNTVAWRSLMREKRNKIAEYMKIKPENLKWYAAFHDEGIYPHIHFIAYSTDPKEAYLAKEGIDGIRSCLAREIFQQDLLQIYSEQTIRRDTLNRESLSVIQEMCAQMQNGVCENPQIEGVMNMVAIIMLCALVCTVPLILICGAITPPSTVITPKETINPPAIIQEDTSAPPAMIEKEGYEIVYNEDIKNSFKEGIVARSIEVMRKDGVSDEAIKKKMMESFSLDKETIDRLLKQ